jgi:hypothetical protein
MKWKIKHEPEPEEGKVIVRKFFAFLPVSTENETRWLEYVTVQGYYLHIRYSWHWVNNIFID